MVAPKVTEVPVGIAGDTLVISGHPPHNGFPSLFLFRVKNGEEEQEIRALSQEQAEAFHEALGGVLAHVADVGERQPAGQERLMK